MMPRASTFAVACWGLLAAACSVRPLADPTADTTSTTTTSATSTSDTSGLPTTGIPTSTTNTTSTSDPLTSSTTAIPDHPFDWRCTPALQDCPDGEKCVPTSESNYDEYRCVPVTGNRQPGDSCTVIGEDQATQDDCELGAWCWRSDAMNQGTCVELCRGPGLYLSCENEADFDCLGISLSILGFCVPSCAPLTQDCPDGQLCLSHYQTFQCFESTGTNSKSFGLCQIDNDCAPGHMCLATGSALECDPNAFGCCQLFCDLGDPDFICPGQGQSCTSIYGDPLPESAPGEYAHIGVCSRPG